MNSIEDQFQQTHWIGRQSWNPNFQTFNMFLVYQNISENKHQTFCLSLKDESEVTDKMSMPVSLASAESHLKSSKRPISFVSIEIQTAYN